MPMNMPLLELACSAKAPNPEAQHATTLRGMCLNLAFANATCEVSRKLFACSINLDSAEETQRRIPHGKRYRRYGLKHCSPVQIRLLMSRGFMPAACNLTGSVLESCAGALVEINLVWNNVLEHCVQRYFSPSETLCRI